MNKFFDLVRVLTATTGTGTIALGAAVSGFLTFAQAGAVDGDVVTYAISDGANSEIGQGTYTASGTLLSRDVVYRSTGAGNTAKIALSGAAQVVVSVSVQDFARTGTGSIVLNTAPTISSPLLTGTVALNGNAFADEQYGDYRVIYGLPATPAAGSIWLGGPVDLSNYYSNERHVFQSLSGTGSFTTIDVTGVTATGFVIADGNIESDGAAAGFTFQARDLAQKWQWYATANVARLWNGSADILSVDLSGNISTIGGLSASGQVGSSGLIIDGVQFASGATSGYNILYDSAGRQTLFLGGIDVHNYHRNTVHTFEAIGGAATFLRVDSSGIIVTGTVVASGAFNKVTITPPATAATLTIANGKTLTDTSGVGAVALKGATGGGFAQAATTDLSDVVGPTAWTPSDGSGASLTFTNVSASYTRIGNLVFAYATLTYPTTASGAAAKIAGFPITCANASYATQGQVSYSSTTNCAAIVVVQNTTTGFLFTAAGVGTTNAQMSGQSVSIMCIYPVA